MANTIRVGRSYGQWRRVRGICGFLAFAGAFSNGFLPRAVSAAEQPSLALQELVLTAHRSVDQHTIAFLALIVGVVLFAVVTAIMLVRSRARFSRLEGWSRDEI